jgi:outer membrane protein OmpA-like peptidoglycan-associated protein
VLDNIFFEFDESTLKPESFVELDYLVNFLQKNSKIRIEISGHTDNQGDDEYNMKLSVDRAKSVFDYIVSKGIDPSRVEYRGYGESKPIASNETEEGRAMNRRTEMMIIDNK